MRNPEDQANETRYQDEETMLEDDKPLGGISLIDIKMVGGENAPPFQHIPSSVESEYLADLIDKEYNKGPSTDYYWLIGIIEDFRRITLGQKPEHIRLEEYHKEHGIVRTVGEARGLTPEEIAELTRPWTRWERFCYNFRYYVWDNSPRKTYYLIRYMFAKD